MRLDTTPTVSTLTTVIAVSGYYRWPLLLNYEPPLPVLTMSHAITSPASPSNFDLVFNSALDTYKKRTKEDLASHPILPTLHACNSPESVVAVLCDQIPAFTKSTNVDERLTTWLIPTVNVLYGFSATLCEGVGLVNNKTPMGTFVF